MEHSDISGDNLTQEPQVPPDAREKTLYYLGIDPTLPRRLQQSLGGTPFVVKGFAKASDMLWASTQRPADVVLLDPARLPEDLPAAELLNRMEKRSGVRPVMFCVAPTADIKARVKALREGAAAFFSIPVNIEDVAAKLREMAVADDVDPYRVMIVDDHDMHSKIMTRFLDSAGMQTVTVKDPLAVISTLESFRPDLLLMDLYMPEIRGDELASLIRDSRKYNDIPIVFVSGDMDADRQIQALSVGGDEFLAKPVERARLIATVKHRIKRARAIRGSSTGSNAASSAPPVAAPAYPQRFLSRLERTISDDRLPQQGRGLFYVGVVALGREVDTTDTVIADAIRASVGHLLRDRLGPWDFAERLGAFEYAMYANRANDVALTESAEGLLNALNHHAVEIGDQSFSIQASIGVSFIHPPVDDALALISRARAACTKVAAEGGGRVESMISAVAQSDEPAVPTPMLPPETTGQATAGQAPKDEPASADAAPQHDAKLSKLVKDALNDDGFLLLFQPVLPLRKHRSPRHEVLLRLKTNEGELIPPLDFIPTAEEAGVMEEIDRWVMRAAFETLQEQKRRGRKLRFFIHQSADSLRSKEWIPWLREQIVRRELVKVRPVLQFRCQDVLENVEIASAQFRILARLGIPVCIVNVTGDPDQMALFNRLPVRIAKLAVSLIANTETNELTQLVDDLHQREARVIATGIENPQTVGRVWNCGFDYIQGNFVQFPVADPDFDASAFEVGLQA